MFCSLLELVELVCIPSLVLCSVIRWDRIFRGTNYHVTGQVQLFFLVDVGNSYTVHVERGTLHFKKGRNMSEILRPVGRNISGDQLSRYSSQTKGNSYRYIVPLGCRNVAIYNQQYRYKILTITLQKKECKQVQEKVF